MLRFSAPAGEGVPLAWLIDVGIVIRPCRQQRMYAERRAAPDADLLFHPEAPISEAEWRRAGGTGAAPCTRGQAAARLAEMR